MNTIKTTLFIALLMLPGFVEAQQQVIVVPETKQQFYGVDTSNPHVGYLNWNIARNAAIGDALRYEQLKPVPKVIIQQQPVAPVYPAQAAQPVGVYAPAAPVFAPPVFNLGRTK